MRDTVTVDGVTLTRAQIEEAKRKLDMPIGVVHDWKPGEVVLCRTTRTAYLVTERLIDMPQRGPEDQFAAIAAHGLQTALYQGAVCDYRLGTFAEIVAFYREAKGV